MSTGFWRFNDGDKLPGLAIEIDEFRPTFESIIFGIILGLVMIDESDGIDTDFVIQHTAMQGDTVVGGVLYLCDG